MKRVFLLIVVPALLVAMGFAQTPAAGSNSDQINLKGCLGGSDGNYTVAEDNTGKIFKITTSSTDLKAYVGQDVDLAGHKGTAENSLAVTELNMISEHCTAAAAAPAAAVSAPAETVSTPPTAAPAAAAPDATVSAPPETIIERPTPAAPAATAPAATVSTPPQAISTPPAAAAPAATVSTPAETASAPAAAAAVPRTRTAAQPHKPAATPAAAPAPAPAEPVSTPVADANRITAPVGPPPQTASTPAAPATTASSSRSTLMLVSIIVVVLLIGAGVPLYNRWRRRKLVEEARGQNLSFTKEAKSDPGKSDTTGGRKAA
jgi:hypothetical protein